MGMAHLCNNANDTTTTTTITTTANLPEIKKGQRNQDMNRPPWVLTGNGGQRLLCLHCTHQIRISNCCKESCCNSTWGIKRQKVYLYQMRATWLLKQQTWNQLALTFCTPIWHLVWQNHEKVFTLDSTTQCLKNEDAFSVEIAQKEKRTDHYCSPCLLLLLCIQFSK